MSLGLMVKVLLHVYNLQCKRFCKEIAGFDIASNWRFRHLATLKSFYKTKGVGFVDCYHKKDQVYHVLFFRTNGTPRSVYFEDLTSNRKMRGWAQYARQFTVLGVYMVRSHPCCRPTARYPCLSCQAKWPEDATEPDLPAATEPDLPAATEPDLPAATEPDLPRGRTAARMRAHHVNSQHCKLPCILCPPSHFAVGSEIFEIHTTGSPVRAEKKHMVHLVLFVVAIHKTNPFGLVKRLEGCQMPKPPV